MSYGSSKTYPSFCAKLTESRLAASQLGYFPLSRQSKINAEDATVANPFLLWSGCVSTSISIPSS